MRRCLSLFMVLLLALRGLLGDAMAMQAMPAAPAMLSASHSTDHAVHAALQLPLSSHHGTADTAVTGSAAHCASAPSADHCGHTESGTHCSTCAMCHAAWCLHAMTIAPSAVRTSMQPSPRAAGFASAPPGNLIKPPIV